MAITTESATKVRQKTRMLTLAPGVFYALKALFLHLAANKGNPDLEFKPFSGAEMAADDGNADKVIADAACSIYAIYTKKRATATAVFLKASDHATAASSTAPEFEQEYNTASQSFLALYPDGWAQGTGFTLEETTTSDGSTKSNAADSVDGFVILGA